jgi:hypothetical protein
MIRNCSKANGRHGLNQTQTVDPADNGLAHPARWHFRSKKSGLRLWGEPLPNNRGPYSYVS